jgi:hypothetical protein
MEIFQIDGTSPVAPPEGIPAPHAQRHGQRLERIEASLTFLEQADDLDQLVALEGEWTEQEAGHRKPRRSPGAQAAAPPRPLELRTAGGLRVQVGRNHRQNAWISLRQADLVDPEVATGMAQLAAGYNLPQDLIRSLGAPDQ